MKPTSKMSVVASSPGRTEKLPAPPFARLLKGKGGSKSRRSSSHSRASPIFGARRRSGSSADIEGEKEPGSPKVTCIGQVRIKKKNKAKGGTLPPKEEQKRGKADKNKQKQQGQEQQHRSAATGGSDCYGCRCFHRSDFCNPFTKLPKTKRSRATPPQPGSDLCHRRLWPGWFSPRCCCYSKRCRERKEQKQLLELPPEEKEKEVGSYAKPRDIFARSPVRRDWMSKVAAAAHEDGNAAPKAEEEADGDSKGNDELAPSTPPKNALLLMRCRSAPQGASSPFTRRFPAPDEAAADADETTGTRDPDTTGGRLAFLRPKVEETVAGALGANPAGPSGFGKSNNELECRASGDVADGDDSSGGEEGDAADEMASAVGPSPSFSSVPLILTRCKSEPAHKASKLAPAPLPDSSDCQWSGGATDSINNKKGYHNVPGRCR